MIALAIGNGESRTGIDLNKFKQDYILVGCNALQRDTEVEHLVCCDRRMIDEALHSPNTTQTQIYVRNDWYDFYSAQDNRIRAVPELPYKGNKKVDMPIHWGSGPYALLVAANLPVTNILLVGFDLYPANETFNNVYKNTKNYQKENSNPIDYSFWEYQISKIFENFPNKSFIIFNHEDWKMPKSWNRSNVSFEVLVTKNLTFA